MDAQRPRVGLSRRVAARPEALPPLRRAVVALAHEAGFARDRVDDVAVAVSEVLTNVVVHAYRDEQKAGPISVAAAIDGESVRVTIRDEGRGFERRDDSPGLGLGLSLVAMIADDLRISPARPSGTVVALRFDASGGGGSDQ
jgi:serine/threonine-protein kinase RsbW